MEGKKIDTPFIIIFIIGNVSFSSLPGLKL
jgi:hypothetical protein